MNSHERQKELDEQQEYESLFKQDDKDYMIWNKKITQQENNDGHDQVCK